MRYDYIRSDGKTIRQDTARLIDLLQSEKRSLERQLAGANRIIAETNKEVGAIHAELRKLERELGSAKNEIDGLQDQLKICDRALTTAIRMMAT